MDLSKEFNLISTNHDNNKINQLHHTYKMDLSKEFVRPKWVNLFSVLQTKLDTHVFLTNADVDDSSSGEPSHQEPQFCHPVSDFCNDRCGRIQGRK